MSLHFSDSLSFRNAFGSSAAEVSLDTINEEQENVGELGVACESLASVAGHNIGVVYQEEGNREIRLLGSSSARAKSRRGSSSGHETGHHHHHDDLHDRSIQTITLRSRSPLDTEKLKSFIDYLLWEVHPELEIFRMKGLLDLRGSVKKNMLQAVYQLYSITETEEWGRDELHR
jgi:G3E family GTPase